MPPTHMISATAKRFSSTIKSADQHITLSKVLTTARIFLPFQGLVKSARQQSLQQTLTSLSPLWLTGLIPLWPTNRLDSTDSVQRASDSPPATVQDMGVDHCGTDVGVPEQFLNRADIVTIF